MIKISRTSSLVETAPAGAVEPMVPEILREEEFVRMLNLERKRTERSQRRFVLMLLDAGSLVRAARHEDHLEALTNALARSARETDIKGWYRAGTVFGIIFTEIGARDGKSVANALLGKVTRVVCAHLRIEEIHEVNLSFHIFPESSDDLDGGGPADPALYPDLARDSRFAPRLVKRSLDVIGSLCALAAFSPLFGVIAIAVKMTSSGPVLFRQERIGQDGHRFTFLKFRSMYPKNDHAIHRDYVRQFIAGDAESAKSGAGNSVYKLTNDPRITPVGAFLRRTSLDELPQFLNVLCGHMSLVGPRPPVPYEFECYATWHRRRLLAVKPGITGLWQVGGRSRIKFDDMVRLDLRYAAARSLWLDLKILFKTPAAVFSRDGAY